MSPNDRNGSTGAQGPSSLLGPEPRPPRRRDEALPQSSPSSLLGPYTETPARPREDLPRQNPSSLLANDDAEREIPLRDESLAAISPSELLPPPPPAPPSRWRTLGLRFGAACAVALIVALVLLAGSRFNRSSPDQLIEAARQHIAQGEVVAAQIQLRNALQRDANHAAARLMLGQLYLNSGQSEVAEGEFRKLIEGRRDVPVALLGLTRSLMNQGKYQDVLDETTADRLRSLSVTLTPSLQALRGRAELALGRSDQARLTLQAALGADQGNADALLGMAKIAVLDKDLTKALALAEAALAKAPTDLDTLLMKGDLERTAGNDDAAVAAYRDAIRYHAEDPRSRLSLASIEIGRGQYDAAAKNIEVVRKSAPDSPTANYLMALVEFRRGNPMAAQQFAADALRMQPTHVPSALLAGASEFAIGEYRRAEVHLKWVLTGAPHSSYVRKLYAATLGKLNQPRQAIEVLAPALEQAPNDVGLLALAGDLHLQAGQFSAAQDFLEKAARLEPADAGRRIGLGLGRLAAGDLEQAVRDLETAVSLAPDKVQPRIVLATAEIARGNYERALGILQALEEAERSNPVLHNLVGSALIGAGKPKEARAAFERALALQPAFTPAAMNLAQLELREGRTQAARKRLEAVVALNQGEVGAMLALADLLARMPGEKEEADRWLERAASTETGGLSGSRIVDHYLRAGQPHKALEVAQRAARQNPEDVAALELLAKAYFAVGDAGAAVGVYATITTLQPKSADAQYGLAWIQNESGKQAAARQTLRKALELDPTHAEAIALLAALEARSGNKDAALRLARQLQKLHPESHVGHVLEGDIRAASGEGEKSMEPYKRGYAVAPSRVVVVRMYLSALQAGKPDEAEAIMSDWLKANPYDVEARHDFADLSMKAGRVKTAVEQYEQLAKVRPHNQQVLNNLAWGYSELGDPRALETAKKALELDKRKPAVVDTLGVIELKRGNLEGALELLKFAVEGDPGEPNIRYHYAIALARSGDRKAARTELQRVLNMGAAFARASEARKLLEEMER